ncbi:MAG TPA: YceI family protein [Thermoanaerobaculia bacterium]|nr:YceI family protein [Thermoanaerobaculia bacterium]
MIRRSAVTLLVLLHAGALFAEQQWIIDPKHSDVSFRIRHLMSNVTGRFTRFSGTVIQDDEIEASRVELVIEAASIDTNEPRRDEDLRSSDFFDVRKHPKITFKSSKITKVSDERFEVAGMLTMRGVIKPIVLPVTFLGFARDPFSGVRRAGFEMGTTINRKDFGIDWNQVLDTGGVLLSDEVVVTISLQATESK